MYTNLFTGVIAPVITPFVQNESIDENGFRKNVEFLINEGVSGVVICGSSGDFHLLTTSERKRLLEIALDQANKRIPVYAGTGANSTKEAVELTQHAEESGAVATLVVPPYYIAPSKSEIFSYFADIAKETGLPICLYNIPSRTQINITSQMVVELAEIPNIVAIKESIQDITQVVETIRAVNNKSNKKIKVLIGHDLLILPGLVVGAEGLIVPMPNVFGREVVEMYELVQKNYISEAKKIQYKLYRFREIYHYGTFPQVIKEALNLLGRGGGYPRRPNKEISKEGVKELRTLLKGFGMLE